MDDHVHVLTTPAEGSIPSRHYSLVGNLFTANRLQQEFRKAGMIWQHEYFDRIVRDEGELDGRRHEYILDNPVKRWPEM